MGSDPINGFFGYYKTITYDDENPATDDKKDCNATCKIDASERMTWWHDNCYKTPDHVYQSRGVEWDWLVFYWRLWTENPYQRYSIPEMLDIWDHMAENDNSPSTSRWRWKHPKYVNIIDTAGSLYSVPKVIQLRTQGQAAGLDN